MKGEVELAMSICLSAYLPVRLSICPSVDHPACLSVTLLIYLSFCTYVGTKSLS